MGAVYVFTDSLTWPAIQALYHLGPGYKVIYSHIYRYVMLRILNLFSLRYLPICIFLCQYLFNRSLQMDSLPIETL